MSFIFVIGNIKVSSHVNKISLSMAQWYVIHMASPVCIYLILWLMDAST